MTDPTPEDLEEDDDFLDRIGPGLPIGRAIGHDEAYREAQEAYDNAGVDGIILWLEYNKPKGLEVWEGYLADHPDDSLPWKILRKQNNEDPENNEKEN